MFAVLCVLATYSCFNLCFSGITVFERWLKRLGVSYSMYMLHGVIFLFRCFLLKSFLAVFRLHMLRCFLSVRVTLIFASISYRFI